MFDKRTKCFWHACTVKATTVQPWLTFKNGSSLKEIMSKLCILLKKSQKASNVHGDSNQRGSSFKSLGYEPKKYLGYFLGYELKNF